MSTDPQDLAQVAAEEVVAQDEFDQVHDLDDVDEDQEIPDAEAAVVPLHPESESAS